MCIYIYILLSCNRRISPYICPCCSALAARFSNLTRFECSHTRDAIIYTFSTINAKDLIFPSCIMTNFKSIHYKWRPPFDIAKKNLLLLNKGVQWVSLGSCVVIGLNELCQCKTSLSHMHKEQYLMLVIIKLFYKIHITFQMQYITTI